MWVMPEVRLQLVWPDGGQSEFYSPSTVVLEYLKPGDELSILELEQRGVRALEEASERVRARYGFACTRVDEEMDRLRRRVSAFDAGDRVRIRRRLDPAAGDPPSD
jgi:uncharacterized repeat protein (TIGR04042 family)